MQFQSVALILNGLKHFYLNNIFTLFLQYPDSNVTDF
jgi:hypothetical protein